MITISVPSKAHLLGEHAVVYGKPALLTAINRRILITIRSSRKKEVHGAKEYEKEVRQLLEVLEKEIQKQKKVKSIIPYSIKINSQVPIGSGLGSSAALSAGLTASLLSFLGLAWDKKIIFDIAYAGEKFFHGNPSGGDLATVIEGGFLWFRKDFEFLKTFFPLPFKPHKNIKKFILINSGKPKESTKEMIVRVLKLKESFPKKIQDLYNLQEVLTKKMDTAIRDGDENLLIECIRLGERNLEKLGVVGNKAKKIIREIEKFGGAAKITGAGGVKGGSGMLLAYHKTLDALDKFFLHSKVSYNTIALGAEGLRQEKYE